MARKSVSKKKAVVPVSDSVSEDGYKAQAAVKTRKLPRKSSGGESTSVSTHEKVALLAYSYWEERGMQGGSPEEDWFRAEREVMGGVSQKDS
jgi:hypothetical protein